MTAPVHVRRQPQMFAGIHLVTHGFINTRVQCTLDYSVLRFQKNNLKKLTFR